MNAQAAASPVSTIPRPRTIVTADPELDDLNSMIRFLLYANEVEIEGLVYASSRFHWRGDGQGTEFFVPEREYDRPQTSWRWAPGERFIDDAVDAYAAVHDNLVVHDPRYPSPDALRAVIREGNVDFEGDTSAETPGSQLIADVLLDDEPGPVFLQLWAGPSTVARALMSIEERFGGTDEWDRVHAEVSAKAIITKFASQDATYDDYIAPNWPGIRIIEVATLAWGYMARRTVRAEDLHSAECRMDAGERHDARAPRRALPRVGRRHPDGAGRRHRLLPPVGPDGRRAARTGVWGVDGPPAGGRVDLRGRHDQHAPPARSGPARPREPRVRRLGRPVRAHAGRHRHVGPVDAAFRPGGAEWAGGAPTGDEASVTRWFADAQADFAARLRWSVTPAFADANHHPQLEIARGHRPRGRMPVRR